MKAVALQHHHHNRAEQYRSLALAVLLHGGVLGATLYGMSHTTIPTAYPFQQVLEVSLVASPSEMPAPASAPQPQPVMPKIQKQAKPISSPTPEAEPLPDAKPMMQTAANAMQEAAEDATTQATEAPAKASAGATSRATAPIFDADYLDNPPPAYPESAKRRRQQGLVVLEVMVSTAGSASTVDIAESSGYELLDNAAKDAVSRWRFVPAKKTDGESVIARVRVPVEFKLR